MYYLQNKRFLKSSLLVLLLICGAGLIGGAVLLAWPATAAMSPLGKAPVRLRLRVDNGTVPSGQGTAVHAEFLDVNYQSVPSDGTRLIQFTVAGGTGSFSPPRVTVRPGAPTADTTFSSGQPGKVTIIANTAGLDQAQTTIVVVPKRASFLSQLFEPVAYAAGPFDGFELNPEAVAVAANNHARFPFKILFAQPPPLGTQIRLTTNPPAIFIWGEGEKDRGSVADIRMPENQAISNVIYVTSAAANEFDVKAVIRDGPEQHLPVRFTEPRPARIIFGDDLAEIAPYKTEARISVRLADSSSLPLTPKKPVTVTLSSEDPVDFDSKSLALSPTKEFGETYIRLKGAPVSGQLRLMAKYDGDDSLESGEKIIAVQSALDKVVVTGPSEVVQGRKGAEFTIRLAGKDGKSKPADWDRKIDLSAMSGTLTPNQVTIARGQESAKVTYVSSGSAEKDVIKAESAGLTDGSFSITLLTALYWLVTFALVGGLIGGVARLVPAGDKVEQVLPRWTADNLLLLAGRLAGSVVGGLFLYLALKLGFSQLLGSPALPAALDPGTKLAAFFLGGIGGFAGTVVLDRLAGVILPKAAKSAPQPG